jgi:hypothetical protein
MSQEALWKGIEARLARLEAMNYPGLLGSRDRDRDARQAREMVRELTGRIRQMTFKDVQNER